MMNRKEEIPKIVFVCQVYFPDSSSTSQLFHPVMKKFVEEGHDVSVLCGYPPGQSAVHKEMIDGVRVIRHGLKINHKNGLFVRGIAYIFFLIGIFFKLVSIENGPRFIGVTNPPFNAHILFLTSKIKRRDFEYILLDLHPEGLLKIKTIRKSWLTRLWINANKVAYQGVSRLFVLGRDMKNLIANEYSIPKSGIEYLPHWSSTDTDPEPLSFHDSKFVADWGLEDNFVVQYSGNMGVWHDMITIVKAAEKLKAVKNIKFLFIGGGIKLKEAKSLADELECDNILWKDFVDHSLLNHSLAASHVSLVSLKENLEGVAVPCKLYGILSSGRPTIGIVPRESEVAYTILEASCGVHVNPGDDVDLARQIQYLANDKSIVDTMGQNAFNVFNEKYTVNSAFKQLHYRNV
ncbi:glycosyltransferase family 4 protein [Amylibacter sp.]|nr:glycosyltransferase family 4 protein [Amylibacter sp.]